jgi:hypothetical protein
MLQAIGWLCWLGFVLLGVRVIRGSKLYILELLATRGFKALAGLVICHIPVNLDTK